MRYSMTRFQWLLTALIAILLTLVLGMALLLNSAQTLASAPQETTGEFDAATPRPLPPRTAQEAYQIGLPEAQEWAADARLWRAQATWSPGSDLQAPPAAWFYTFYSESQEAAAHISVSPDGAQLIRTRPVSDAPPLQDVQQWKIDSSRAFELVHKSGGEAFTTIHPQHSMHLTLFADAPLRWRAQLINEGPLGNRPQRQLFELVFSAADGRLLLEPLDGANNDEQ